MSINLPSKVYSTYELQAPSLSHLQKSVDRAVKEGRVSRLTDKETDLCPDTGAKASEQNEGLK